eukprot:TRINITY_DN6819_c0_g1_i3.p1 TRINITY_DN6819_c0_g1~~TRINITY_DN6819_c0_g1_i3.p1  ORF type:complete len:120 (+),score=20.41 TRINITY_DN6819_c0_g1_i3:50-409(+)
MIEILINITKKERRTILFFFLMIRRPPRSTLSSSSAASDVYKRQESTIPTVIEKPDTAEMWAMEAWISDCIEHETGATSARSAQAQSSCKEVLGGAVVCTMTDTDTPPDCSDFRFKNSG